MARVLILGGGFAGVVAAERLADQLSNEHQITLVSRSRHFVFYPALVRLAFGECGRQDVSFDLRQAMLNHRVNFIEAEVARIDPIEQKVMIAHGEVEGKLPYDYLIFALGRRLATERITGFYEHANHLLSVDKALKFGKAVASFREGTAVIGQCREARLPVPVYETAFALDRRLRDNGQRDGVRITVVNPESAEAALADSTAVVALKKALDARDIELLSHFPIAAVTQDSVRTHDGRALGFDLLMLLPPFRGSSAASYVGITDDEGYIKVDQNMRVRGQERVYAVGDCTNFFGPKMGHMAVRQANVAATNVAAEIQGREPMLQYVHEMRLVVDASGRDSLYLHKGGWADEPGTVRQGRFWSWAKRAQKEYWEFLHS